MSKAFMRPVADHFRAYQVDTSTGIHTIPEDLVGFIHPELLQSSATKGRFLEYLDVSNSDEIYEIESEEGWYGRLSAPGYLDCTEWDGPYKTEKEAIASVMDLYEVNEDGNDLGDE